MAQQLTKLYGKTASSEIARLVEGYDSRGVRFINELPINYNGSLPRQMLQTNMINIHKGIISGAYNKKEETIKLVQPKKEA